jgi:hypothetical protein
MSITLDELVLRLQENVPAENGVPKDTQYERMIKEAVRDFSRRCGLVKRAVLHITAGTASYALEADFLKLITLIRLTAHDGVIVSSAGLIPVSPSFIEDHTIANGQITFYPTPNYTLDREYKYKAGWALSENGYSGVYETMSEDEADIVLLKAQALAWDSLWRSDAGDSFKFSIGDESYDMSNTGNTLMTSKETAESGYLDACQQYNGNTGRML